MKSYQRCLLLLQTSATCRCENFFLKKSPLGLNKGMFSYFPSNLALLTFLTYVDCLLTILHGCGQRSSRFVLLYSLYYFLSLLNVQGGWQARWRCCYEQVFQRYILEYGWGNETSHAHINFSFGTFTFLLSIYLLGWFWIWRETLLENKTRLYEVELEFFL